MIILLATILVFMATLYLLVPEGEFIRETEIDCSKVDVRECQYGLGCFANRDIKKDEVVEVGLMTPMEGVDGNEHEHMFSWSEDRKLFAVGSGCLPYYNHSDEPNVIKIGNLENNTMKVVALRDIKCGEELRNRYISKAWRKCFQNF